MGKLTIGFVVVIVLAVLGGAVFLALWNPPRAVGAGRKGAAGCALPEVTRTAPPRSDISRHLEAFLEMLAAERGAARLTLAAYRNDLRDLGRFLAARETALEAADETALHAYLAAATTAALGAAQPGPADLGDPPILQVSGRRRRAARRPDGRARHPAPRPPAAQAIVGERDRSPARGGPRAGRATRARGCSAWSSCLYATGMRVSELVTLPLAAALRDPRFLLVRGKGGRERVVPLASPARRALAAYLDCRARFLPDGQRRAGSFRRAAARGI